MITLRKAGDRGHFDHGWLDTCHTFSFGDYYDPQQMGFRALRVINEDRIQASRGFPTHGHRDMEIITYPLSGRLEHRDSLGSGSVIVPGEVQRMTAGTGITHSEFNASRSEPLHLLQIWLLPARKGLKPSYEQKEFSAADKRGRLLLVVSPDGRDGSLRIHQDVNLHVAELKRGDTLAHRFAAGRHGWMQMARGNARLNGQELAPGDGAAISEEPSIELTGTGPAELLLFDLN